MDLNIKQSDAWRKEKLLRVDKIKEKQYQNVIWWQSNLSSMDGRSSLTVTHKTPDHLTMIDTRVSYKPVKSTSYCEKLFNVCIPLLTKLTKPIDICLNKTSRARLIYLISLN